MPWLLAVMAWAVPLACSDEAPGVLGPDDLPRTAIVSDPAQIGSSALAGGVRLAPSASDPRSDPVYVSLPPGSFPGGSSVEVRNRATGIADVIPMVEGGFDPVPVVGLVGDTLDFVASSGSGSIAEWFEVVEAVRPPIIVRTHPSRGRRDVPLRPKVEIVFSEPMDPSTLGPTTVRLLRGGVVVSWQMEVTGDLLGVALTPDEALAPSTEYVLSIGAGVRDLDGDALESGLEVRFSTAIAEPEVAPGPGAFWSPTWGPDGSSVAFVGLPDPADPASSPGVYVLVSDGSPPVNLTAGLDVQVRSVDWSLDGTKLVFSADTDEGEHGLFVMEADGSNVVRLPHDGFDPDWSPDGSQIAFSAGSDVWLVAADGSRLRSLTTVEGGFAQNPDWSPDGSKIAFQAEDGGLRPPGVGNGSRISVIDVDGSGLVSLIADGYRNEDPAWSPDGQTIVFARNQPPDGDPCGFFELYAMSADGAGLVNLTNHWSVESGPRWSADGTRIAFVTNREDYGWCHYPGIDSWEHLWVMNADGSEPRRLWP